jgi:exopolyphosphatase / guanosine-5'-triphosphate,3'-diphosphate pyrophosphatase
MEKQQIGIIDMGSNSVRFVIYEVDTDGYHQEIQNLKVSARLSTYINDEGEMTGEGIEKILNLMDKFSAIAAGYKLTTVRGAATAAVRNAKNRDAILKAVAQHSAFPFEVLSEEQEAYYGYLAVTNSTDFQEGVTIDIGGGSTEITYFENREMKHSVSFPFGALTLKKKFVKGHTPTKKEEKRLFEFLQESYRSLPWLKNLQVPVIGIGGSARNLALVHQNRHSYPLSGLHQYVMTAEETAETAAWLTDMPLKKREKTDGLSKDRADIILPAVHAMQALLTETNSNEFIISNYGLREGLFFEKLLQPIEVTHFPSVKEESLYQLSNHYRLKAEDQKQLAVLSSYIANELMRHRLVDFSEQEAQLLRLGAKMFYVGKTIHPESKSQHTFYMLTNQSIDGLSHMDRLGLAFTASFTSRSQLKFYARPFKQWVDKESLSSYELLGAVNKLAYALNITGQQAVKKIEITKADKKNLYLRLTCRGDVHFEEEQADKYKKHLERALKRNVHLGFVQEELSL